MSFWDTLLTVSSPIPIPGKTEESPLATVLNPTGAMNRSMMADMLMPKYNQQQEQGKHGGFNKQMNSMYMPLLRFNR